MPKPADTLENIAKCICARCPVYNECTKSKDEVLYCARMVSVCEDLDKTANCICPECPVYKEHKLEGGYFCIYQVKDDGSNNMPENV